MRHNVVMTRTQVLVQLDEDLGRLGERPIDRLDAAATSQLDHALRYALEIRW